MLGGIAVQGAASVCTLFTFAPSPVIVGAVTADDDDDRRRPRWRWLDRIRGLLAPEPDPPGIPTHAVLVELFGASATVPNTTASTTSIATTRPPCWSSVRRVIAIPARTPNRVLELADPHAAVAYLDPHG